MPPSPEQVAADKAAIDADLSKLIAATRQRVKLPPADPAPAVGPFSHLRAALKVMKRDALRKQLGDFEDSWLDHILREQQDLPRPYPRVLADLIDEWGKKAVAQRKLVENRGAAVVQNEQGAALVLAPLGPGALVYAADAQGVTLLGRSVAEFVQREVARLLGTPLPALEPVRIDPAIAKRERALAKLRKSQPRSSVVHGALVVAWSVRDLASNDELLALDELAREHGLALFAGCGDVDSTPNDTPIWLGHWLVGVELASVRGTTQKRSGFAFDAAALAKATKQLEPIGAPLRKRVRSSKPERGTYVVARGGLAAVQLVKGVWAASPTATAPVRGVQIGGADACAEAVTWTAKQDKELDRTLARDGIEDARYFLVTRFD